MSNMSCWLFLMAD